MPAIITGSLKADDDLDIVLRGVKPENVGTVVLKTKQYSCTPQTIKMQYSSHVILNVNNHQIK